MPDQTNNSLVNLGEISKPADTLIKKVSKAVGGIFKPYQITRVAKAEAEASIIKVQAEIEITELHRRAMHRFIEEEAKKQENIEEITSQAIPHLGENADAEKMEDDWVTNFFDKSRIISDKEMQQLWARVLAGEVNTPGTYSKRTVNILGDIDKQDAELFTTLCRFVWVLGNASPIDSSSIQLVPLVFDTDAAIYTKLKINFGTLTHLETIGLIRFNNLTGFRRRNVPKNFLTIYYGQPQYLEMAGETNNDLLIGHVVFTQAGNELARICSTQPVEGFMDYVRDKWKTHLLIEAPK